MKKTSLIYMILALLTNAISQPVSAQYKVTYNVTYKPSKKSENFQQEVMALKIFNGKSYFYNETKYQLDSLYDAATKKYSSTGVAPNISQRYDLNFGIYKDRLAKIQYIFHDLKNSNFYYQKSLPDFKWNIQSSLKKKIQGYDCVFATCFLNGEKWTAWFSDAIAIPEGPYKFYGLPGLILELTKADNSYRFSMVSLQKFEGSFDIKSIKGIKTTEKDYLELTGRIIRDPAMFSRAAMSNKPGSSVTIRGTDGSVMDEKSLYKRIEKEFAEFRTSHDNPIEKDFVWIR